MQFPEFQLKDDTGQVLPSNLLENMYFIACFAPDLSEETIDIANQFDSIYQKLIIRNIITMVITPCEQDAIREKVLENDIKVKMMADPGSSLLSECSASGRTTFFVGKNREILARWDNVKPEGHANAVYDKLKTFFKPA